MRTAIAVALAASLAWTTPAGAGSSETYLPDGWIRLHPESPAWHGDNALTDSAETVKAKLEKGETIRIDLAAQNDGNTVDQFFMKGECSPSRAFRITFTTGGRPGFTKITALVKTGKIRSPEIRPGHRMNHYQLLAKRLSRGRSGASLTCSVTYTSATDSTKSDTVIARISAR